MTLPSQTAPRARRAPRRALLLVVVALAVVSGWELPASAHAQLLSTSPAAGAVLAKSPGTVELTFGEDVELEFGSIRVFNGAGHRVDSGQAHHVKGDDHSVEIGVPSTLPRGGYVVTWRVISADSHPVHGAFTFAIGSGSDTAATSNEAAQLLAAGGGDATVGITFGVIRALAFLALAILVGSTAFVAVAWPAGRADQRVRRLLWAGWVGSLLMTVAAIAVQGPYGAGESLSALFKWSVISGVLHTRFGEVYGLRAVVLVVLALPLLVSLLQAAPGTRPSRVWQAAAAVVGLAILVTPGLAGHAATGTFIPLAIPFDLVHVTGAAVWVGGLALLLVAGLHRSHTAPDDGDSSVLADVVPRFSQWAFAAVVAIAVSGAFAAWRQAGLTVDAYTDTTYGRLLIAKTVGFALLLLIASSSRRLVHGRLALPGGGRSATKPAVESRERLRDRGRALRRAVAVEVVLALAVFGLTAVLVNSIPARQALALPFSIEVKAGPNMLLDLDVDPAKAGPVAIHAYTLTRDGAQQPVQAILATIELDSEGIAPITIPIIRAGPAHFAAYGFDIPIQGTWTIRVDLQLDKFTEVAADPINVRIR